MSGRIQIKESSIAECLPPLIRTHEPNSALPQIDPGRAIVFSQSVEAEALTESGKTSCFHVGLLV